MSGKALEVKLGVAGAIGVGLPSVSLRLESDHPGLSS